MIMTTWTYKITIADKRVGQTVKDILIDWLVPQRIRGALRIKRAIRINDCVVSTNYRVNLLDELTLILEEDDFRTGISSYQPNTAKDMSVIYETDDLVIVDKPAGMKMHPHSPNENDTLLNYLAGYFVQHNTKSAGSDAKPYMVHRIDRETSGAVIVAKNPLVVPILNQMLKQKAIKRTYLTWVTGTMKSSSGYITKPIGIDPKNPYCRCVEGLNAQSAKTYWQTTTNSNTVSQNSLLRVQLDTGRMHQIRVHLASIGHPIVGDTLYNNIRTDNRMMLHSESVKISLPFDGPTKIITGAIPTDFPKLNNSK